MALLVLLLLLNLIFLLQIASEFFTLVITIYNLKIAKCAVYPNDGEHIYINYWPIVNTIVNTMMNTYIYQLLANCEHTMVNTFLNTYMSITGQGFQDKPVILLAISSVLILIATVNVLTIFFIFLPERNQRSIHGRWT